MWAAVTEGPERIRLTERAEPGPPPAGQVLLRPEVVGVCGSDMHLFAGDVAALSGAARGFPRVQGHEISARVAAVGDGVDTVSPGDRVAVWPLMPCGTCYPCRLGRGNVCARLRLFGVHVDGGLQEQLLVPAVQVFPATGVPAAVAAFAEPTSVAVHTVRRGRVAAGEHVLVIGAGALGQACTLAALDLGGEVLVADPAPGRRELAERAGARTWWGEDLVGAARDWTGGAGPEVVIDATGSPAVLDTALELVIPAGRIVVVGMSSGAAPVKSGVLPIKEVDVLGVSCCHRDDFGAAVDLVTRRAAQVESLISHRVPLAEAARAIGLATARDGGLKVLVTVETKE